MGVDSVVGVGQSVFEVFGDMPQIEGGFERALAGEVVTSTVQMAGGTLEVRLSPLHGQNDEVGGVIGVATDITERRRAEERLRESEERYRTLFEDSRDAIFIGSRNGKVVDANQAALELFGLTRDEAIGSEVGDTFADPTDRERFRAEIGRTGYVRNFEVRLLKKDGTEMYCLLAASRQFDAQGNSLGVRGIIHDITERKRAEDTLRGLAVLEERNRMAREIHDTLAQGFTGTVLQLEAAEQAMEVSPTQIEEHLGRAKNLARESLQEARRSVWDLLPRALEERSIEAALHQLVDRWADDGPENASFSISGEKREVSANIQVALLRICQESLTNIRRHARATTVKVDLAFYPDCTSLGVHDDGKGFKFEKVKAKGRQSGFGLSGMEQRTHLVGGTFTVKSHEGAGALVEVRIPTS